METASHSVKATHGISAMPDTFVKSKVFGVSHEIPLANSNELSTFWCCG